MLYTEQYRAECAAVNPGDQSGPNNKRVDSVQTSSRSSLQWKCVDVCAQQHATTADRDHQKYPLATFEAHNLLWLFHTLDTVGSGCLSMLVEVVTLRANGSRRYFCACKDDGVMLIRRLGGQHTDI